MDEGEVLRGLPLFAGLGEGDLARVAARVQRRLLARGEVLCRRGDEGRELYVVVSGAVEVRHGDALLHLAGPGHVLGELSVLSAAPRSADLVAAAATELLALDSDDVLALLDAHPAMARALLAHLAGRFRAVATRQLRVEGLVRAYRERGHVLARLDPLDRPRLEERGELELEYHGLSDADLDTPFAVVLGAGPVQLPLRRILDELRQVYCGSVGVQYGHIDDLAIKEWLRDRLENPAHRQPLERADQLWLLRTLTDAEVLEATLQRRFPRHKRFSLEGAETLVPLLMQAVERAAEHGVEEVVLGMSHRGRLNVLVNLMGMPARAVFDRLEKVEGEAPDRAGDVPFHLGFDTVRATRSGPPVRMSLCFNPSHLEWVAPVVIGRVRARQDRGRNALALVVHGDAAFAGQGIVQETLNLSELPGYAVGGTVHVILDNQIGFTTPPEEGRSTRYATDVARMLQVPVLHVNGERPEAVDAVIRLALDFRAAWRRDVVVDMYCFRRHGHSEHDDPSFTQPLMARRIQERPPLRAVYADNLIRLGQVSEEDALAVAERARARLAAELELPAPPPPAVEPAAPPLRAAVTPALPQLLQRLATFPAGFDLHPRVAALARRRRLAAQGQADVDWATGEALAYASLLDAGVRVRLTGQDSQRGTFAHRHAVVHDQRTGARHAVLASFGPVAVHNSPLSEAGVLAFEFGYSLEANGGLVVWEAQFGDFANAAQVVIDQFVVSSEEKWHQPAGLVLLLPHGLEGQGPEHSSARPERFLQLAVGANMEVTHLSTAAQVYHRLREQALGGRPRPLVAFTPKRLLWHAAAASSLAELASGAFRPVLPDPGPAGDRVLLCAGQVYADLVEERERRGAAASVVRVERLHPFPREALMDALAAVPAGTPVRWVQEEPANMGALQFMLPQLVEALAARHPVDSAARPPSAVPATGWRVLHERQRQALLDRAFST